MCQMRVGDILVTGKNDIEHLNNLGRVIQKLSEAGLTVKPSKCYFLQDEVTYCGYRVRKEGVRPLLENVEAVQKAPEPTNVSELRSYLGMLNYYLNYLPDLATVSEPLHRLLRKGCTWKWGEEQSKSFCYASRTLSTAKSNYGHIEKEGLALVFAVKKCHHYLFGHRFTMVTNHKPLLGLFSEHKGLPDRSAARILRWALLLSAYDYKLEFRPGVEHANADGLSRLPLELKEEDISQSGCSVHMMELVSSPVTENEVRTETRREPILSAVLYNILNRWKDSSRDLKDEMKPFFRLRKDEFTTEGGCVLWGSRVFIPKVLRKRVLMELHGVHVGVTRMKMLARSFVWWPNLEIWRLRRWCIIVVHALNNTATLQ